MGDAARAGSGAGLGASEVVTLVMLPWSPAAAIAAGVIATLVLAYAMVSNSKAGELEVATTLLYEAPFRKFTLTMSEPAAV